MLRGAKNPRVCADLDPGSDERRRRGDRRDPSRAHLYVGVERRKGPRRAKDLPRPVWQRPLALSLAVALGVAAGLALGSLRRASSPQPQALAAAHATARVDPELLAGVQHLRDQAEALTPAAVELDERAYEQWLPRVAEIELALADPATPAAIRTELEATLAALTRVGVLDR